MGQGGSKTFLEIGRSEWRVERVLGKGAFGTVHVLYPPKDAHTSILALKRLDKAELLEKGRRTVKAAVLERRLLAELSHPFLVNLHGALQNSSECFMVLDMMAGGDLGYWLSMRRRKDLNYFDEDSVRFYVANCLLTLRYMHSEGVVHRDIKPESMFFFANEKKKLTKQNTFSFFLSLFLFLSYSFSFSFFLLFLNRYYA
jgi:serine/threonine protein kinase